MSGSGPVAEAEISASPGGGGTEISASRGGENVN
jgi:hypothetical protein